MDEPHPLHAPELHHIQNALQGLVNAQIGPPELGVLRRLVEGGNHRLFRRVTELITEPSGFLWGVLGGGDDW